MRKKLLAAAVLAVAVVLAAGCRKKDTSSGDSRIVIWGDEKAAEVPVTETSEKEATEAVHEEDLATKKEEQAEPEKGKGTFDGWADSGSVEIRMSDGTYQTFFVESDEVRKALNQKGEGSEITFSHGAVEGQVNRKIISVE